MTTTHPIFEKFVETIVQARPPQAERVSVISAPMVNHGPGVLAYQITGLTAEDVQREIDRILTDVEVRSGMGEFRHPAKSREPKYFGRWQARGWTRVSPIVEAAE